MNNFKHKMKTLHRNQQQKNEIWKINSNQSGGFKVFFSIYFVFSPEHRYFVALFFLFYAFFWFFLLFTLSIQAHKIHSLRIQVLLRYKHSLILLLSLIQSTTNGKTLLCGYFEKNERTNGLAKKLIVENRKSFCTYRWNSISQLFQSM